MRRRSSTGLVRAVKHPSMMSGVIALWATASAAAGQELEPRSYSPSPVGANFAVVGYGQSTGEILFDASGPISNAHAVINLATAGYSRVVDIGGHQSSLTLAVPYLWGEAEGDVGEVSRAITRSGFGDARLKFSTLLVGGPALSRQEFAARKPRPIVGASLLVVAPTGEYMPDKLINLGANRWAFKPEIGVSVPVGRWQADAYAAVWIYGDNDDFVGGRVRSQEPLGAFQAHLTYTFRPGLWAGLNATYYTGGATVTGGIRDLNRQDNARIGLTFAVPVTRGQSLQFSYSEGALTRYGGDFTSFAVAWRALWFD